MANNFLKTGQKLCPKNDHLKTGLNGQCVLHSHHKHYCQAQLYHPNTYIFLLTGLNKSCFCYSLLCGSPAFNSATDDGLHKKILEGKYNIHHPGIDIKIKRFSNWVFLQKQNTRNSEHLNTGIVVQFSNG
jgi:hypothetical protein